MPGTDKCKIQVLHGAPKKQELSSNVKDGAWLVGGLRYMTTAVFLATPRVLSGQVPSRGPEIQPPGLSNTTRHYPAAVGIGPPAAAGRARTGVVNKENGRSGDAAGSSGSFPISVVPAPHLSPARRRGRPRRPSAVRRSAPAIPRSPGFAESGDLGRKSAKPERHGRPGRVSGSPYAATATGITGVFQVRCVRAGVSDPHGPAQPDVARGGLHPDVQHRRVVLGRLVADGEIGVGVPGDGVELDRRQ